MFDSQSVRVAQTACEQFHLIKKKIIDYTLGLLILAFFGEGNWEVCHSELCLFGGSYSKTQVSSPVIPP
jgi:hypothetical protein